MKKVKSDILNNNEKEVLFLIVHGYYNSDIAKKLSLSAYSLKLIIASIYKKFGVHNKVELTLFTLKNGIVDIDDITLP